jgi:hypothetical protein
VFERWIAQAISTRACSQEYEGYMTFQNSAGRCLIDGLPRPILQGYLCTQEWEGYMTFHNLFRGCSNDGLPRPVPQGYAARNGKDILQLIVLLEGG